MLLSIDVGSTNLGYAVLNIKDNNLEVITSGCIVSKDICLANKLGNIRNKLKELFDKYDITEFCYEEPCFFNRSNTASAIVNVVGILLLLVYDNNLSSNCFVYSASEVKKCVVGKGKADKKEIETAIKQLIPSINNYKFITDHESDAIAIGYTHLFKQNKLT